MKTCIAPQCDRKANGRFCMVHRRQYKTGEPLSVIPRRNDGPGRFWQRVNKSGRVVSPDLGPCWEWTGSILRSGYGMVTRGYRQVLAHRYAWELSRGPIADVGGYHGMCVCHRCDVRHCVNPDHMFLGTHLENMHDMVAKGRIPNRLGEQNPVSRHTEQEVREMRERVAHGEAMSAVARRFGCSKGNVRWIVTRKTWRHVA